MGPFAALETSRLKIRLLSKEDVAAFFEYRTLEEVYRYQAWKPDSVERLMQFAEENASSEPFKPGLFTQFAIIRKSDSTLVGDLGIKADDDRAQFEIGYTVAPQYQRIGYAFEACEAMLSFLFDELRIHRAYASVDPDNRASIKLLERLGFRFEAHFVKSYRMRGEWYDDCIYGLLDEEWGKRKK